MGWINEAPTDAEVKKILSKYNVPRIRLCIKCGKSFKSEGAHNRKCKLCKLRESARERAVETRHDISVHKSHVEGKRYTRDLSDFSDKALIADLVMGYL